MATTTPSRGALDDLVTTVVEDLPRTLTRRTDRGALDDLVTTVVEDLPRTLTP